jgi:NhaA family Na+:H+ antiporter
MLLPAAIYVAFNTGRAGSAGWAIPMATDIAFAVGVLTLLGSRVPPALRILLLALAVIDDLGAIMVIALFYSGGIGATGLAIGASGVAAVLALRWIGVRSPLAYVVPGILLWAGLYGAGIHPTLAGVILGLITPVRSWYGRAGFTEATQAHLGELDRAADRHATLEHLDAIERARREAVSPSERLLHRLHPWVAYGVMPLFALANAGVAFGGADLSGDTLRVFLGITLGLAVGKPVGIFLMCLAAKASGVATRPTGVTHVGVGIVGVVAGIGFTMSIFIASLAFPPGPLLDTAKLAILVGSASSMVIGLLAGRLALRI